MIRSQQRIEKTEARGRSSLLRHARQRRAKDHTILHDTGGDHKKMTALSISCATGVGVHSPLEEEE